MGLRLKVILTLVGVIIPLTLGFSIYRFAAAKREFVERRADRFAARVDARGVRRCERRPEQFAVHRRGLDVYAYNPDFEASNPDAPPFPPRLADRLPAETGEPAHVRYWFGEHHLGATAVRAAESGPCAIVLVQWSHDRHKGPPVLGIVVRQTAVLALSLTLVGLLISVPLVGRVRLVSIRIVVVFPAPLGPRNP